MNRMFLWGLWTKSHVQAVLPYMKAFRRRGHQSLCFVWRSDAKDLLGREGFRVIDVTQPRSLSEALRFPIGFRLVYEIRSNQIALHYGKGPSWDISQVMDSVRATREALNEIDPREVQAVVVWGGRLAFQREMRKWANDHSKQVFWVERGHFPKALIIDRYELDENTEFRRDIWPKSTARDDARIQQLGNQIRQEIISGRNTLEMQKQPLLTREKLLQKLGLPHNVSLIFLPLQVPVDTNMIFRSFDIEGNEGLISAVQQATILIKDAAVIAKFHPADSWTDRTKTKAQFPSVHFLEGYHVHDLIRCSNVVVSLNSQVVVEAIIIGKQVITCSRSHFGGLANRQVHNTESLESSILELLAMQPNETFSNQFAFSLKEFLY